MWSARTHPQLQPSLSVTPAVKVLSRAYAQPCDDTTNPCANFGAARTHSIMRFCWALLLESTTSHSIALKPVLNQLMYHWVLW